MIKKMEYQPTEILNSRARNVLFQGTCINGPKLALDRTSTTIIETTLLIPAHSIERLLVCLSKENDTFSAPSITSGVTTEQQKVNLAYNP